MLHLAKYYRFFFIGSLLFMLTTLWIGGYDSGFGSDELDMNAYGKANMAYYMSGGKDTSFMHPSLGNGTQMASTLQFYGSGFEYISIALNKVLGTYGGYEINVRHMLCQLFAVLGLLFSGLIAYRVTGRFRAAIITIWLLFLTPQYTGLSIFDTKDIPFAASLVAALYYMIRFVDELPKPSWKSLIWLILALALALSIRIGGALVFLYLLSALSIKVYQNDLHKGELVEKNKNWVFKTLILIVATMLIVVLAWPFLLKDPVNNLLASLHATTNFPQRIPFNFKGEHIDSLSIPQSYIVQIFLYTVPLPILIMMAISIPYLLFSQVKAIRWEVILLLLAGLFPIAYVMYANVPLYNGWRQVMFAYPPMIILLSLGMDRILMSFKRPILKMSLMLLCVLSMSPVVYWSFKHFQYQFMYYNELAGGFKKAYYIYETDYWQVSAKEGIDWLIEHKVPKENKDTLILATNAHSCMYYYLNKRYPKLKLKSVPCGIRARHVVDWQFAILNNLFLTPEQLEQSFANPGHAIHTVSLEELPLTQVLYDTERFDLRGARALVKDSFRRADSFLNMYLKQVNYPPYQLNIEGFDVMMALACLGSDRMNEALTWAKNILKYKPNDYHGNLVIGIIYAHTARTHDEGIRYLKRAIELNPNDMVARDNLREFGLL